METLGRRIRRLRKARDWTQQTLAERAGTNHRYISALEKDTVDNPGKDLLQRLARALDVPVAELLDTESLDGPFPAAKLRGEGLSEADIRIYSALWDHVPLDRRAGVLGDAHILALLQTRRKHLQEEHGPHNAPVAS